MNWQSRRAVLIMLGAVCLVVFIGGMAAAWNNRHHTICPDGQTEYRCHDGRVVTTAS